MEQLAILQPTTLQASPMKPRWQSQTPVWSLHVPLLLQSFVHDRFSHASPAKPGAHLH
jgi:hypothetical protein